MKLLIFLLIMFSISAHAKCKKHKIFYVDEGKKIFSEEVLCQHKGGDYFSKNCLNQVCMAIKAGNDILPINYKYLGAGNPAMHICLIKEGTPQTYWVVKGEKEIEYSRCLFHDRSFVSTQWLYENTFITE